MALFVIGDLHLSLGGDKPMDVFRGWDGHVTRLEEHWRAEVADDDTVVLAGDTSWAMKLEDCGADFTFINSLPGRKLVLKGNHDYWWSTRAKMEGYLARQGFGAMEILHNNSFLAGEMAVCGTRGWIFEPGEPHDEKVQAREAGRLRMSLEHAAKCWPEAERVAVLHYPPLTTDARFGEVIALLDEFGVRRCFYGHLHGASVRRAAQGAHGGVCYRLVSADALRFKPLLVPPAMA